MSEWHRVRDYKRSRNEEKNNKKGRCKVSNIQKANRQQWIHVEKRKKLVSRERGKGGGKYKNW